MKNAILTYCNFQVDPRIATNQEKVIKKYIEDSDIKYEPYFYNAPDGVVFPNNVIDQEISKLFYFKNYDNVLILDIDCIPLSLDSLEYVFKRASEGYLLGNVQRSNHLDNNQHLFVGSSCLCISKKTFNLLGRPSSDCTPRSDICEEWTFLAEKFDVPVEFFVPGTFEGMPHQGFPWPLKEGYKSYGIGTTFVDSNGTEMFYHLFESRWNLNVERFVSKCQDILSSTTV